MFLLLGKMINTASEFCRVCPSAYAYVLMRKQAYAYIIHYVSCVCVLCVCVCV